MTVYRPRSGKVDGVVAIPNPGVQRALQSWEDKVLAAREEGYAQGMQDAEAMLAEAQRLREEAEAVQAQAAEQVRQQAAEAEEGYRQDLGRAAAALHALVQEQEQLRRQALEEAEHASVELACALAGRILRHEVGSDPRWMHDLLREALELVPDRRQATVRMHPEDARLVRDHLRTIEREAGLLATLVLEEDGRMQRGDCLIESAGTSIDASVGGSWERLCQHMTQLAPEPRHQHQVHGEPEVTSTMPEPEPEAEDETPFDSADNDSEVDEEEHVGTSSFGADDVQR